MILDADKWVEEGEPAITPRRLSAHRVLLEGVRFSIDLKWLQHLTSSLNLWSDDGHSPAERLPGPYYFTGNSL